MARTHREEPDEDETDDWDESDEYDAGRDYDPDDPETFPAGVYDDDGPTTVSCPYCKADVFEDSEQCPRCGTYITGEDAPQQRAGAWVILMILALLAVALWISGR